MDDFLLMQLKVSLCPYSDEYQMLFGDEDEEEIPDDYLYDRHGSSSYSDNPSNSCSRAEMHYMFEHPDEYRTERFEWQDIDRDCLRSEDFWK